MRTGRRRFLPAVFLGLACLGSLPAVAKQDKPRDELSIGIVAHASGSEDSQLRDALGAVDASRPGFVLVNGIKLASEPCSDELYLQRKTLLENVRTPVVVSLAASDWTACLTAQGQPAAMERLNRLRELLFMNERALDDGKLLQLRQSGNAKFRNFAENARWEMRGVQFATVNLPANNNHYLPDAGRNSEFEDRLIATNDWLQRIVSNATRKKLSLIVLFSDANPFAAPEPAPLFGGPSKRDGFREVRRKITTLAATYRGKILLVHGQTGAPTPIRWQKNIGVLAAGPGNGSDWIRLAVNPGTANPFRVDREVLIAAVDKDRSK